MEVTLKFHDTFWHALKSVGITSVDLPVWGLQLRSLLVAVNWY